MKQAFFKVTGSSSKFEMPITVYTPMVFQTKASKSPFFCRRDIVFNISDPPLRPKVSLLTRIVVEIWQNNMPYHMPRFSFPSPPLLKPGVVFYETVKGSMATKWIPLRQGFRGCLPSVPMGHFR